MANLLTTSLIKSLAEKVDPIEINSAIMTSIGDYLSNEVTLNITFVGTLIQPPNTPIIVPDIVNLDGKLVSSTIIKFNDPSGGDGLPQWNSWMSSIYLGITKAIVTGVNTVPITPVSGFPTLSTPSWTRDKLKSAYELDINNPQFNVLDAMTSSILSDLKLNYIKSFPANYMGTYIGVATVTSIVTP